MFSILSLSQIKDVANIDNFFFVFYFPFTFCLETKSNKKFKATKIPPAQSYRLTNAICASKTEHILHLIYYFYTRFFESSPHKRS